MSTVYVDKYMRQRLAGLFFRMNLSHNDRDLPEIDDLYAPEWAVAYANAAADLLMGADTQEAIIDDIEDLISDIYAVDSNVA